MSSYLETHLRQVFVLAKIFGISPFVYENNRKFVNSKTWKIYSLWMHWILIWPICIFYIFICLLLLRYDEMLMQKKSNINLGMNLIAIRTLAILINAWLLFTHRSEICRLLNLFVSLSRQYRILFGQTLIVPWYQLVFFGIRELMCYGCTVAVIDYSFNWIAIPFEIHFLYSCIIYHLYDIGMIVHLRLLKGLETYLGSRKSKVSRQLYWDYFLKLQDLRKYMQLYGCACNISRLIMEIMYISFCGFGILNKKSYKDYSIFSTVFMSSLLSNFMHCVILARFINRTEKRVFEHIHLRELRSFLKKQNGAYHILDTVEMLHLYRCMQSQQSTTIFNLIYIRDTLILEVLSLIVSNAILIYGILI